VAKPNYSFEKRQRELAKKKKKEVKEKEKADRKVGPTGPDDPSSAADGDAQPAAANAPAAGPGGSGA